jgi:hypothetical protein
MMSALKITPIAIKTATEYVRLNQLYREAFTPWYDNLPPRRVLNCLAKVFPEGFLQAVCMETGTVSGYAFALPIYWSGDPNAIETYDFYTNDRFRSHPFKGSAFSVAVTVASLCYEVLPAVALKLIRSALLSNANSLMLLAMIVKPEARGSTVPSLFFAHLKAHLKAQLGCQTIVGPFRPSGFGLFKGQRRLTLSQEIFDQYCAMRDGAGRLIDPWLRSAEKNGVAFFRTEIRSIRFGKSVAQFKAFKRSFKPDDWYQGAEGTFECGEVPTWYVDPNLDLVYSVEPNYWGKITL